MTLEPKNDGQDHLIGLQDGARAGDAASFGKLIREHDHDLRGVVWSVVRDHHAVDDIMQSSYEKAFRSIKTFSGTSTMKTWLHSICYRTALDHFRYEGRRKHGDLENIVELNAFAGDSAESAAVVNLTLSDLLEKTDPETRALLMMTAGLGFSYDETANVTGIERGTVASKIGRAREKLRKEQ